MIKKDRSNTINPIGFTLGLVGFIRLYLNVSEIGICPLGETHNSFDLSWISALNFIKINALTWQNDYALIPIFK